MSNSIGILIFDSSAYTRSLLVERIARINGSFLHAYQSISLVDAKQLPYQTSLVVLNHHTQDIQPFEFIAELKASNPELHVMVIVSPGNEKRAMDPLRLAGKIDALFEKPIDPEALAQHVSEQVHHLSGKQRMANENLNLLRFLPTGSLRRIFEKPEPGRAELFDMTVMFTDIRDSSRLISESSAQTYFARLNTVLGEQARLIRLHDGMVVKTTGDGLLAIFEGAARCHLALKCAHAIQHCALIQKASVGLGISDGLVLTGILGTHEHLHFDVIGMHVHLASRLCAMAQAGEILATQETIDKAHFEFSSQPLTEKITVRGFDNPVSCSHIQPNY